MNTHISLSPSRPLLLKGEVKVLQNWVGAAIKEHQKLAISKKICLGNQKREGRRNAKVIGRCDVTISYDGN